MTYEPTDILRKVAELSWTPRFSRKGELLVEVPDDFYSDWYHWWNDERETLIADEQGVWYLLKPDGLLTVVTFGADGSLTHSQYKLVLA